MMTRIRAVYGDERQQARECVHFDFKVSQRVSEHPSPWQTDHYPQVVRWTQASGTTGGKGEVPSQGSRPISSLFSCRQLPFCYGAGQQDSSEFSLAKEGWPRHQVNGPVPLMARPGWFVPLPIIGGLNQPPRLRPLRRLHGLFLMVAATPP